MRSSISSSNDRAPTGQWAATWLVALSVTAAVLGALEIACRRAGHRPSVVDDPTLWACRRQDLNHQPERTVAVLGTSRIHVAFDPDRFHQRFPHYRAVQLAVDALGPAAALQDLAYDEHFYGVVLCSMFPEKFQRTSRDEQQGYVRQYRSLTLNARLNRLISAHLQDVFTIANPRLQARRVLGSLVRTGRLPTPIYVWTRADRTRFADYSLDAELAEHRCDRLRSALAEPPAPTPEDWLEQAMELAPFARKIQQRGGQVVFMNLPVAEEQTQLQERRYPRQEYWDRFAARIGAPTIHYLDVPVWRCLPCPDGTHIDGGDRPRFTDALGDELIKLGVLKP